MAQQKPQEKKLLIELRHPEEELRALGDALKALSQPGLSREEVQRLRKVVRAARAYHGFFRPYVRYRKFQAAHLERKLAEIERN